MVAAAAIFNRLTKRIFGSLEKERQDKERCRNQEWDRNFAYYSKQLKEKHLSDDALIYECASTCASYHLTERELNQKIQRQQQWLGLLVALFLLSIILTYSY